MNGKWYEDTGASHDVVVSSRVRLARGLEAYPFPAKCDNETSKKIVNDVKAAFDKHFDGKLTACPMNELSKTGRVLAEDHIISPDFLTPTALERVLLTDESGKLAVMINEEDHVRIQAICPGFDLEGAYEIANRADDALAAGVSIAFDETLGYLTACPTNLGTGLRASVMLHLPGMCAFGYIKTLSALMTKIGLTVRGTFGEGSEATACLFQLSNQVTLGLSEADAIEKLKSATAQIIEKERSFREQMLRDDRGDTADKLWRSFGTLKYARKLDTAEASRLLSNVRLAAVCGVINECKNINFTALLFDILPAHIASRFPEAATPEARDRNRANLIRETIEKAAG